MTRVRLTQDPPLCTVEEAFTLLAQAKAFIEAPDADDFVRQESRPRRLLKHRAALDASLVAVEVAVDTGDPHLLSAALEGAQRAAEWGRLEREGTYATAVEEILPNLGAITNVVRDCAVSNSAVLRAAVAKGLGVRALRTLQGQGDAVDAEAARMVTALLSDGDPRVRQAARECLGGMAPPAWLAFFPSDPLASLSAAEAARLRAPLDAAAEALEKQRYGTEEEFERAIGALPDNLAVPILESWVRSKHALHQASAALLDRWLLGDEDGARVVRWFLEEERRDTYSHSEKVARALRRAPRAQCIATCLRAARQLMELDQTSSASLALGQFLEQAWPNDADRVPLLEIVFGMSLGEAARAEPVTTSDEIHHDVTLLKCALGPGPGLDSLRDTLIEVFVAGAPGRWQANSWMLTKTVSSFVDPRLRAFAERQLATGDNQVTWALSYLTGAGHDPQVDPPIQHTLTQAIHHATTRSAILEAPELASKVKKQLRALLAREDFAPEELIQIAYRTGGISMFSSDDSGFDFTDEEMRVIRAARVQLHNDTDVAVALQLLPPFPAWTEKDYEFVTRAMHRFGNDGRVTITLATLFEKAASPKLLSLAEELSRIATRHAAPWAKRAVAACRPKQEQE